MENNNFETPSSFEIAQEELKLLLTNGYLAAKETKDHIFNEDNTNKEMLALAFLSRARTKFQAAEILYTFNKDLTHIEFEDIFHQFDVFDREVLTNYSNQHSHQWSDIEYRALISTLNAVTGLLNLESDFFKA